MKTTLLAFLILFTIGCTEPNAPFDDSDPYAEITLEVDASAFFRNISNDMDKKGFLPTLEAFQKDTSLMDPIEKFKNLFFQLGFTNSEFTSAFYNVKTKDKLGGDFEAEQLVEFLKTEWAKTLLQTKVLLKTRLEKAGNSRFTIDRGEGTQLVFRTTQTAQMDTWRHMLTAPGKFKVEKVMGNYETVTDIYRLNDLLAAENPLNEMLEKELDPELLEELNRDEFAYPDGEPQINPSVTYTIPHPEPIDPYANYGRPDNGPFLQYFVLAIVRSNYGVFEFVDDHKIGYTKPVDTATINTYLKRGIAEFFFPKNTAFVWTKNIDERGFLALYAIEINSFPRSINESHITAANLSIIDSTGEITVQLELSGIASDRWRIMTPNSSSYFSQPDLLGVCVDNTLYTTVYAQNFGYEKIKTLPFGIYNRNAAAQAITLAALLNLGPLESPVRIVSENHSKVQR